MICVFSDAPECIENCVTIYTYKYSYVIILIKHIFLKVHVKQWVRPCKNVYYTNYLYKAMLPFIHLLNQRRLIFVQTALMEHFIYQGQFLSIVTRIWIKYDAICGVICTPTIQCKLILIKTFHALNKASLNRKLILFFRNSLTYILLHVTKLTE